MLLSLLTLAGCVIHDSMSREALLDLSRPFGRDWSIPRRDLQTYVDSQNEECREFASGLDGDEMEEYIDSCTRSPILIFGEPDAPLPPRLDDGAMKIVVDGQSGKVLEYSHIFYAWFASFPLSVQEEEKERELLEREYLAWQSATRSVLGRPDSLGEWEFFDGYVRTDREDAPCAAWVRESVLIFLCKNKPISPDAAEASLSIWNLNAISQSTELLSAVMGPG